MQAPLEEGFRFDQADNLLNECLEKGYVPDDVWVMDVAYFETSGNAYVLEMGSFSACGLYGCDTDKLYHYLKQLPL